METKRNFWAVIRALATSRKFLVALIVAISTVVLFVQGAITADQLADALLTLAVIVIAATAGEDIAAKTNRKP